MANLRRTEGLAFGTSGSPSRTPPPGTLLQLASDARLAAEAQVGLAVVATERGADTTVRIGIDGVAGRVTERRAAFMGGEQGRLRAALVAAAVLREYLQAAS